MIRLAAVFRRSIGSAFLRAVGPLLGGNAFATALPILAAPLLGRIYAPAEYGALAQYMAPAAILSVLSSLQFQHAIIKERTDRNAGTAAWLSLLTTLGTAIVTSLVIAVVWGPALSGMAAGPWFALLPISVAGAGFAAIGQFLANRYRMYPHIAWLQVANAAVTVFLSITLGLAGWGADGLLAAYFLGQVVLISGYAEVLWRLRSSLNWPGTARLQVMSRKHWKLPTFVLPSAFCDQANMQAPVFALTALGADAMLGSFTRARQLASMPVTVVGQSVAQVFRREAAALYHETGNCRPLMLRTALSLFVAGIGPCLLFMAAAPWLFAAYLGPAWREAGEIARILAPMLLLQVIVSPISTIFYITNREQEDFIFMIIAMIIMISSLTISVFTAESPKAVIFAFSAIYSTIYILYLFRSFFIARKATS
jgi:O-antigen/teichoic acid export membrane protein